LLQEGINLLYSSAKKMQQKLVNSSLTIDQEMYPHHGRYEAQYDLGVWNGRALDVFQYIGSVVYRSNPGATGLNSAPQDTYEMLVRSRDEYSSQK
jgi:hypothetical protein